MIEGPIDPGDLFQAARAQWKTFAIVMFVCLGVGVIYSFVRLRSIARR